MQKLILILILLASINSFALDPVQDYISRNTFPAKSSKLDGELFAGQPWTGDNGQQPPGGYLLRFNAPIGVNGTPVTFIASSLFAYLRGSNWFAYQVTDGEVSLLSDQISFGSLNFYLAPATKDHGPVLCEISNGKTSFGVSGICVNSSGKLVSIKLIGAPRDQDKEDADPSYETIEGDAVIKQNQLTPFNLRMEKILLAEYLKNSSAKWRVCKSKSVRGQGTESDEKEHTATVNNFSQEEAVQLWKSKRASVTPPTSQ